MAQIIKVRIFLNVELSGLHENIQNFYHWCSGSQEIAKNKVAKVLADTLYSRDSKVSVVVDWGFTYNKGCNVQRILVR